MFVDTHCWHMGTAIKHPVPDRVRPSFVIFDILLTLRAECQSARMSKITNDGLNRFGTGCSLAVLHVYDSSGHQRVNILGLDMKLLLDFEVQQRADITCMSMTG